MRRLSLWRTVAENSDESNKTENSKCADNSGWRGCKSRVRGCCRIASFQPRWAVEFVPGLRPHSDRTPSRARTRLQIDLEEQRAEGRSGDFRAQVGRTWLIAC